MRYLVLLSVLFFAFPCFGQSASKAPSDTSAGDQLKNSPRHGEWVEIDLPGSDVKLKSWVVYPERKDKAPVVIVIHEIFGLSDWVRSVADQLAADGFIAVAPDLLSGFGPNGGGSAELGDKVRETIGKVTPDLQVQRLNAARSYALALPSASGKSAVIGFCWGGSASFNYAAEQKDINAALVFYGTAPAKEKLAKVTAPVFGFYGENDNRVTSTVAPTEKLMKETEKRYTPHIYAGAGHGFLRQQSGQNGANQKAADEAWTEVLKVLREATEPAK